MTDRRSSQPPIEERMRTVRRDMQADVRQLADSTARLTNWREYVQSAPLVALGAAAAAGYVCAPRRRRKTKSPLADPAPASTGHSVLGSMLGFAAAAVSRAATNYVGNLISERTKIEERESLVAKLGDSEMENPADQGGTQ